MECNKSNVPNSKIIINISGNYAGVDWWFEELKREYKLANKANKP